MPEHSDVNDRDQTEWTPDKDAYLMRNAQKMKRSELAKRLKTTIGSLNWRLGALGIRKARQVKVLSGINDIQSENTRRQKLVETNTLFEQIYTAWANKHNLRVWEYRKASDW